MAARKSASKRKSTKAGAPRQAATTRRKRATAGRAAKASPLDRVRAICLALPQAVEVEAWGTATFRVNNKLFAMYASETSHHSGGRAAIWINSNHVEQDLVVRSRPDRYFKPPYVGPGGWIGAWLDGSVPWNELTELLRDGYRQRAPKRLAAQLED